MKVASITVAAMSQGETLGVQAAAAADAAVGCWLLAIGSWAVAIGYRPLAFGWWQLATEKCMRYEYNRASKGNGS